MQASMQKHIAELYERPALRFLKFGEPWEPLADLLFGPPTDRPDPATLASLETLWLELRADILAAQQIYQPNKKPWGARFDRYRKQPNKNIHTDGALNR
jgi:hypothetical protein